MTQAPPRRRQKREKISHCHKQVKLTAQGLARATYENLMSSCNPAYEAWRKRFPEMSAQQREDRFVAKYWAAHIDAARATMARLLTQPIDETLKAQIEESLILDATLMRGRREPMTVLAQK